MEPTGLAVGIVGLASSFSSAVECFRYVRIVKRSEYDFQTLTLELDMTQVRLTRWGNALGLTECGDDSSTIPTTLDGQYAKDNVNFAIKNLDQIAAAFENAEKKINSMNPGTISDASLNETTQAAHNSLTRICEKRLPFKAKLKDRVKWALWEKEELTSLINDIDKLVTNVMDLLPPRQERVQNACQEEVSAIKQMSQEVIATLEQVAKAKDKDLKDSMDHEKSRPQTTINTPHSSSTNTFGDNNSGFQIGHYSGTMTNHFGGGRK
ncbi:hypothetical protein K491DRAFT_682475 [Lophiostoma macrostomum CBS 122681]|uniref:Prion-inhibition and propagation HeLo domain-containing protein n=1 Tax=Lophiostoma macrostomum CBS 122681 TaxID=1314788 RepID=A0A6A6SX42_9PLEO|nr:hypothetical protein K491DRAFT_682475 [Lophiostoma macrostomum CBS 122681]